MSAKIRRGRPDDADFLARVMMLASRGHLSRGVWDLIAGGSEENCLDYLRRLALAAPVSLCHYSSFIVTEYANRPAAALCGFDPSAGGWQTLGDAMQNVQREIGWTQADEKASADRTQPVWKCTFDTLEGAWVIESVATILQYRRHGLADSLMAEILEIGRARGHRLAQLTVLIGNLAAQRAYEKAGFTVRDEKRHPDFQATLGASGFMRMVREY
ncbi:MAG TPA: GNAT family N-acetyltransferase [Rhizomicrobium sp.]|nr:GNAT family N-acetyltransferase [Rhizomicrobium sp.]